jgi:RND family efflux transporter MFP subunit
VKQQLSIEQATLRERQAQAGRAAVTLNAMKTELKREEDAFALKVASKSDVDAARAKVSQADADLAAASAAVEQQRATIAKLEAKLKELTLVAPFDGTISFLFAHEGDRVDEGRPVIRVDTVGKLIIRFAIPADKFGSLKSGDAIDLAVDNAAGRLPAVVRGVQPSVDPVAKMQLADATLDAAPAALHSGARCRVFPRK